jgi:hypothetical protein
MVEKQKILDGLQDHIKSLQAGLDRLQRVNAPASAKMQQCADIKAFEKVLKSIDKMVSQ